VSVRRRCCDDDDDGDGASEFLSLTLVMSCVQQRVVVRAGAGGTADRRERTDFAEADIGD
jgi:hypothetical protein